MSSTMRGADIVARSLERLGCRRIFTLSGNHIMSLFGIKLHCTFQAHELVQSRAGSVALGALI
jgi:acetolactate synthase I/II/III large subunit